MADSNALPDGLLSEVKKYLNITWDDATTDSLITGYIRRGIARLNRIAGAELDYTSENLPRQLLFDYVRYANSQALEVFEQNFESQLLDLHLKERVKEYESQNADGVSVV